MNSVSADSKLTIGLALGSGSSRGLSHIGIIKALDELGVVPDVICGTSAGALVGASYIAGKLDALEAWACSLTKYEQIRFFDINTSFSGFVNIARFRHFLNETVAGDDALIEDYPKKFAAVATNLNNGREVWLMEGSLTQAVWASLSLPGLFPAIRYRDDWLVDGGLVNPVPVSVCRALGADVVIAVNLNGDIVGRLRRPQKSVVENNGGVTAKLSDLVREYSEILFPASRVNHQPPGMLDAIAASFNITQDRITRSRLAGDPPDIILTPKLSDIGLLEIYRAREAIMVGEECVRRKAGEIADMLKTNH